MIDPKGSKTRRLLQAINGERDMTVTFSVQGYVKQNVVIVDHRVTIASLERGLKSGHYLTTIQEGGEIITRGGKVVGRVESLSSKTELEYFDFEVGNVVVFANFKEKKCDQEKKVGV